jgi:hypothetical protein
MTISQEELLQIFNRIYKDQPELLEQYKKRLGDVKVK